MQMIVNRLLVMEPETHLQEDELRCIKGVRLYAVNEHYATVTAQGNNIICRYNHEFFILHDLSLRMGFGLIQDVFDFYDGWEDRITRFSSHLHFQETIDSCFPIFQNPLLLLDSNYKVLGMSTQYDSTSVDPEWKYLSEKGFSSISAVRFLNNAKHTFTRLTRFGNINRQKIDSKCCFNYSTEIIFNEEVCGYLVLFEHDRIVNSGDCEVLKILTKILSASINRMNFTSQYSWGTSVFSHLLLGKKVSDEALSMQLNYYNWHPTDTFHVIVFRYRSDKVDTAMLRLLRSSLIQTAPFCITEIYEDSIAFIVDNDHQNLDDLKCSLKDILLRNDVSGFISLSVENIANIDCLFHQARVMSKYILKPTAQFYRFENFAVAYILLGKDQRKKLLACYPPIRKAWEEDTAKTAEYLDTLQSYLENGMSPTETTKALFIARNTLNYRLNKIEKEWRLNLKNPLNRKYYLISIEFLKISKSSKSETDF